MKKYRWCLGVRLENMCPKQRRTEEGDFERGTQVQVHGTPKEHKNAPEYENALLVAQYEKGGSGLRVKVFSVPTGEGRTPATSWAPTVPSHPGMEMG